MGEIVVVSHIGQRGPKVLDPTLGQHRTVLYSVIPNTVFFHENADYGLRSVHRNDEVLRRMGDGVDLSKGVRYAYEAPDGWEQERINRVAGTIIHMTNTYRHGIGRASAHLLPLLPAFYQPEPRE